MRSSAVEKEGEKTQNGSARAVLKKSEEEEGTHELVLVRS